MIRARDRRAAQDLKDVQILSSSPGEAKPLFAGAALNDGHLRPAKIEEQRLFIYIDRDFTRVKKATND